MSDLILEQVQSDVYGLLKATPGLSAAVVVSANEGDVESEVLNKLAPLTGAERGLAMVVLLPELTDAEENLPGPVMDGFIEVQVIESVIVNRGTGGTGVRASTAALRALGALHNLRVGNHTLYAQKNPIEPLAGKKGIVTYVIRLYIRNIGAYPVARVSPVVIVEDAGEVTLSCATGGAAIYYTLDGSFPGESNAEATLYAAPITILEDATLRAAAYLSPLNPSDISEQEVSAA